jgi:hypothetical protein
VAAQVLNQPGSGPEIQSRDGGGLTGGGEELLTYPTLSWITVPPRSRADDGSPHTTGGERELDLRAQARHARERYDLYRAKAYGLRPTSPTRLRELERECLQAEARLAAALAEARRGGADDGR